MRWRASGLVGVALLLSTACGPQPRPTVGEWRDHWLEARALVPQVRGLEGEQARAACERLLGALHNARRELLPTPVAELDRTVEEWVHAAEGLAFECPSAQGKEESFAAYMRKVELLGAEIDAALVVQTSRWDPE